ncbi:MAG: 2-hydroxyacid dehydrogenase [Saprospiraceae bacterium]|nr:2-hydroxyacid dehydrogenase [Saprospiraceae bacterium]
MKITFFSARSYDRQYFEPLNAGKYELHFLEPALNEQTAMLATGSMAVCVFVNDRCDLPVLQILKSCGVQIVALRCAGFNNVDLEAAQTLDLPVVRVPAYSPHAVAEHAVALILTLNRKTHKAYNRVRDGNFELERLTGFNLHGKTVGVIGTGRIGSVFAGIMRGFGCRVLASDVVENAELSKIGMQYVPLHELLRASDIISLHCPLSPDTRHLISHDTLAIIKPGAMIINTGRGALIDTKAAIEALKSGRIGYLGIDVYEQEENLFFYDHSETIIRDEVITRLMSFPNVLITAHQAFFTDEALTEIARVTLQNLEDFEAGKPLVNQVLLAV